jgi:hypothetical protein
MERKEGKGKWNEMGAYEKTVPLIVINSILIVYEVILGWREAEYCVTGKYKPNGEVGGEMEKCIIWYNGTWGCTWDRDMRVGGPRSGKREYSSWHGVQEAHTCLGWWTYLAIKEYPDYSDYLIAQ